MSEPEQAAAAVALPIGQPPPTARDTGWADSLDARYFVTPDIPYVTRSGHVQTLDFYRVRGAGPHPTVLLFHGGGWMKGDKAEALDGVLPWLVRGWNVANANYRLGSVAPAPAAAEDARCARYWLAVNAVEHAIDTQRIVVTGYSAGGHLALLASLLPDDSPLGNACRYGVNMPAALVETRSAAGASAHWSTPPTMILAVVNFFGITDLTPLLAGSEAKTYALAWLGTHANDEALVNLLSPVRHVGSGVPPVLTIHGDADPTVPFSQAQALHRELSNAAVHNHLVTVSGGGHGGFSAADYRRAWLAIDNFLGSLQ